MGALLRVLLSRSRRAASISRIWSTISCSRAISRRSSASVFGGSGILRGAQSLQPSAAWRKVRLEAADAEPRQGALDAVDNAGALADQTFSLAARPLGVFFLQGRDQRSCWQWSRSPRSQPRKARFNSAVSSRSVLARRCSRETAMLLGWITWASMPVPPAASAPATSRLDRPRRPPRSDDRAARPSSASSRQRCSSRNSSPSITVELLQRLAIDAGHDPGNQPTRLAHLDHRDQRAILIESGEASAQVIRLWHGALPSVVHRDDGAMPSPLAP